MHKREKNWIKFYHFNCYCFCSKFILLQPWLIIYYCLIIAKSLWLVIPIKLNFGYIKSFNTCSAFQINQQVKQCMLFWIKLYLKLLIRSFIIDDFKFWVYYFYYFFNFLFLLFIFIVLNYTLFLLVGIF